MRNIIINDKIHCLTSFCDNQQQIVIYCHGFGESKERIIQHNEVLNKRNIGIVSFDFPCHGEDKIDYKDFSYILGYNYIDSVVNYIKKSYPGIPIAFIGSSFGGYMVLNYINDKKEIFNKIFLKYPAVNFYECTKRKLDINDNYFNHHDYYELPSGYRIYKMFYLDAKRHDIMKNFNKFNNNIYIIHGDKDRTVLLEDVIKFTNKNNIRLKVFKGAEHGMRDYLDTVNSEIINFLIRRTI